MFMSPSQFAHRVCYSLIGFQSSVTAEIICDNGPILGQGGSEGKRPIQPKVISL